MEKNKKILKVGIVVISLSLIFALSFSLIIKLKNPVFLKNYIDNAYFIDDDIYSDCELILHYITNINDDRYITDISFDEAPLGMDIITSDYGFGIATPDYYAGNSQQTYGRYKVKTIYVKIDLNKIENVSEDLELNNAKIFFDNGTNLDVDLGRIRFYEYDNTREYFGGTSSGSSSDGTGHIRYEVLKDITLLNVESTLLDTISDTIELKIGDKDYKEIKNREYKKSSSINIDYHRNYNNHIMSKYISYNISPKLIFQDENGNILTSRVRGIINNHHDFNFIKILKYLRARGEI
ncbi:MAG: hypothetical protein GX787_06185 [Tissierellia bacterium]|jgi:hypothetical protein|nr:hypothetical protein [Tissierellia bacterium]